MAESDSWWNSFLVSAKEKSISALNVTKRDLTEFMTTVTRDTTNAVSGVADSVKSYIQQDEEKEEGDEKKEEKPPTPPNGDMRNDQTTSNDVTVTYDRSQTVLEALRSDPNTYCTVPEGQSEEFSKWNEKFNLTNKQEEISKLLVMSNNVRKLHAELVPSKISYESFWLHYFFRIHLLEEEQTQRAKLMERVHSSQGQLICWDEEEIEEEYIKKEEDKKIKELEGSPLDKAMTDSSESFVCISEDGQPDTNTKELPTNSTSDSPQPIIVKVPEEGNDTNNNNSDSDWEKWDD